MLFLFKGNKMMISMKLFFKLVACVFILQILSCTEYHYEYIPPSDHEGIACTRHCMDKKWDCSNKCQKNHSTCLSAGKNNTIINMNNNKISKAKQEDNTLACSRSKSSCLNLCARFYNDCYKICGGRIHIHETR